MLGEVIQRACPSCLGAARAQPLRNLTRLHPRLSRELLPPVARGSGSQPDYPVLILVLHRPLFANRAANTGRLSALASNGRRQVACVADDLHDTIARFGACEPSPTSPSSPGRADPWVAIKKRYSPAPDNALPAHIRQCRDLRLCQLRRQSLYCPCASLPRVGGCSKYEPPRLGIGPS